MLTRYNGRPIRTAILVTIFAFASTAASAGTMDVAIQKNAPAILKFLRTHEPPVENVGVLKFLVRLPSQKRPSFHVGRLNYAMATRLENALILADRSKENPIGVTRSAGSVVAESKPNATYLTPKGRWDLFQLTYPLAWADKRVKVDGFLTGSVVVGDGYKQSEVNVFFFHKKDGRKVNVTSFKVPTDRILLSDMNMSFYLAKRYWKNKGSNVSDWDEGVLPTINPPGGKTKKPPIVDPGDDPRSYLTFDVYYDGQKAPLVEDGILATPKEGQNVLIKLKSTKKIGLVVLYNGVNTLYKEEWSDGREPKTFSMWILEPNKPYHIRGFYRGKKEVEIFKALSEDESKGYTLAPQDKLGLIELYVFREGAQPDTEPAASLQLRSSVTKTRGMSRMELRKLLAKTARIKSSPKRRGLVVGGEIGSADLKEDALTNPVFVSRIAYTYWKRGE